MKVSARTFGKSRRQLALSAAVASFMLAGHASAQLYWDTNGTTLGLGGAGTWDTVTTNWNLDALGQGGGVQAWTGGNTAVFSAGTTSTGSFTVTVPAGVSVPGINGITFEEGVVTLAGGDATSALGLNANAIFQHGNVGSTANSRTHAINLRLTGTGGASFLTAFPAASTGSFILNADNSGLSGIIAIAGAVTPPTAAQGGAVVLDVRNANALGASGFANRVQFGVSTLNGFTTNAALSRVLLRGGLTINKDFELSGGAADNLSAQIRNIADTNTITGNILLNGALPNQSSQMPGIGADGGTLILSGVISGVDSGPVASGGNTWTKTGTGTVILAGSSPNTATGLLRVWNGMLVARKDGAFGPAGAAADIGQATIQNVVGGAQSSIAFDGGVNYQTLESVRTAGSGTSTGFNGQGQVVGLSGHNIFAGNLHFTGGQPGGANTPVFGSIGVQSGGTLELSGKVWATVPSPDPRTIVKLGDGTLLISGENDGVDGVLLGAAMDQTSLYGTMIAQGGALVFRGNGALRGSDVGGTLGSDLPMNLQASPGGLIVFDESAGSPVNGRLRANAQVQLVGGEFRLGGHAINPVTQSLGSAQVASYSKLSVSSPGGVTTLDLGSATRNQRGTALILGAGSAAAKILSSGELGTNIGGGGVSGSPLVGIVPALVGDSSLGGSGTDFVTNDPVLGLRPLLITEYAPLLSGSAVLNNVSTSGAQSVTSNTTVNSLKMAGGTAVTINGGNTLNINSGAVLALGDSSISGGAMGNTREAIFHVLGTSTLTVGSVIGGPDGLTKSGTGVLVLSGNNTYNGDTSVNSGVLQFSGLGNIGASGAVVLNGGTLRPTADLTLPSGRPLRVGDLAGGTVEVATGATINLGDGITGNGLLIKTGGGTLNPQASNAGFNGNIRVDAGTFNAANVDQLGNGNLILNNGALNMTNGFEIIKQLSFQGTSDTIAVASGQTSTLSGGMVGPANLTIEGGGTLVQNGALATNGNFLGNYLIRGGSTLAYSSSLNNVGLGTVVGTPAGYWTLDNGTLAWLNSIGTAGTFSVTPAAVRTVALLAGGGTIFVDNTGSIVHNASVISGVGKLTKAGGGTLTLSAANTFSGGLQIDSGWVRATQAGLAGAGNTITFNGGTLIPAGNITGTRPVTVTANNGIVDAISSSTATTAFNTSVGAVSGSGKLTVINTATTTFTASNVRLPAFEVQSGTATLAAGTSPADPANASVIGSVGTDGQLTLTGATLNVTNNALIVHYNSGSPKAALEALLASGYAGGSWNGTGINSSSAAANTGNSVGIAEASEIGSPATFAGQPIDNTTVLMRYTRSGDANLDGITDIGDFALLGANFNVAGTGWSRGNFNYDGITDIGDFALLAANFNQSATGDLPRGAAVPEPAALSLIGLATALLGRRRR